MLPWLTFIYKFSCILTPLIWIPQRTIAALIPTEWSWTSNTWSPIFILNSSPSQTSDPQTLCCIPVLKISKKVSHETFETSKLHFFSQICITITVFPEIPNESSKFSTDLHLTPTLDTLSLIITGVWMRKALKYRVLLVPFVIHNSCYNGNSIYIVCIMQHAYL